jgi:hypothetical protein
MSPRHERGCSGSAGDGSLLAALEAAQAVDERLHEAARSAMVLPHAIQQSETRAKLGVHPLRRIPHELQAAAPRRSIRSEARHDNVAPGPHDTRYLCHITGTIPRVGQEVKYGSIVPDSTGCGWQRSPSRSCARVRAAGAKSRTVTSR